MRLANTVDLPLLVEMRGVSRNFGEVRVLDNVSLSVPNGTILGVVGPSGSGKTTLIRILTGTLTPSGGDVRVLGERPDRFHRSTRERIGYMPQQFVLYPELTAAENVSFVASLFGLFWGQRGRRVRQVLEMVELWDVRDRRAGQLSGGMQKRLELACALVHQPTLLFVDEPTAGLDPMLRQTIWTEFRAMRDAGRTLVVTTQYVGEAEYCDEVAVIAHGRLVALAPPEELRRKVVGGEMLQIETQRPFDGQTLNKLESVIHVKQTTPWHLLVKTSSAGLTMPRVLEAIAAQGVQVKSSSEYRPSFDEVFAELIAQTEPNAMTTEGSGATTARAA